MGWDDDEDVGIDSDDDQDQDEDEDEDNQSSPDNVVRVGQGLLMGRLTRFLDNVPQHATSLTQYLAAPDEDDGWDDDGLDELVDNDEDASGWQDDTLDNALAADESLGLHEESQLLEEPVHEESRAQEGWADDDNDLEGLDEGNAVPSTQQVAPAQHEGSDVSSSGWSDEELDSLDEDDEGNGAAEGLLPSVEEYEEKESGWADEDLDGLDEVIEAGGGELTAEASTPPESAQGDGWADEELEGLEDVGGVISTPSTPQRKTTRPDGVVVDHVPTTPRHITRSSSMMTAAGDESTVLRENAREDDEEDDAQSNDFGPVVDRMPSSHDPAHSTRTVSTVAPSDLDETTNTNGLTSPDAAAPPAEDAIVDHLPDDSSPKGSSKKGSGIESTVSVAGDECTSLQDNARGDEVAEGDFGPVVDRMPSMHQSAHAARTVSTVAPSSVGEDLDEADGASPEAAAPYQPTHTVVDHLPYETKNTFPNSGASAYAESTMTVAGDESTVLQENVQDDEAAEGDFGPVVDRMPSMHQTSHPARTVSTIAPSCESEDVDAKDSANETASLEAVAPYRPSDAVVDHVPEDFSKVSNRDSTRGSTMAAASQMSVASELSNTIGDEALESDTDPKEENYGPVVDHTPLQQSPPSLNQRGASVNVQAPIEEIEDEDEDDERVYYGPMVDHTPNVQPSAACSVAGSMAVMAPPSEMADDSDNELDERTEVIEEQNEDGSSYVDDDTLDAPTPSLVSGSKERPLVDHVPRRTEARPTDASTLVVVDPSEVSTVGDMTYEEQQYGPVVDHTPPSQPFALQPSAAGSTVVAAATSVCQDDTVADDLDDVADEGVQRDENESEGDDGATLPTLDNQPPMEANVVDHVPEADPVYRIDSELTIGPTQSILSPDETRDEDYGLVVDHTPVGPPSPPSRGSMAVLAPASVVDEDAESTTVDEEVNVSREQQAREQPASEQADRRSQGCCGPSPSCS